MSWQARDRGLDRLAALAAVLVGVLAAAVFVAMPSSAPLAAGWSTPIIAFELARTEADLAFLAGPGGKELRAAMDAGHRFDMVFPFAYAALIALGLMTPRGRAGGAVWRWVAAGIALLIIPADLVENVVLLRITADLETGLSAAPRLAALFIATWTKWGLIGVALALLGLRSGIAWPLRVLFLGAALSVAAAVLSGPTPRLGELMALAVTMSIAVLVLRAVYRVLARGVAGDKPGSG